MTRRLNASKGNRVSTVSWMTVACMIGWAVGLLVSALFGVTATYQLSVLPFFVALYSGLATGLVFGARWLSGWGRLGRSVAALGLAGVPLWHLRELTGQPQRFALLLVALFLASVALLPLVRRLEAARRGRLDLFVTLAIGFATTLLLVVAYHGSSLIRWHLLRHNTLVGTVAFYCVDRPVAERRGELFERLATTSGVDRGETSDDPTLEASIRESIQPDVLDTSDALDASDAPNIVFLLLDTLRRDALAGWGASTSQMPLLDARLEAAWRFTDVWAAATWTRPSMASYFTGLQPEAHGARGIGDALGREHLTLAEALAARGYSTTAIVTNWGAVGAEVGFDQGFDTFHELRAEPYARAAAVNRALEAWLASAAGAEAMADPVFLYLHFLDPHEPYLAGVEPRRRTPAEVARAYRSELAELDEQLDIALERLEATLEGPTRYVLVSDHGEEFYEHELFGHGFSLYEEVLSVPLAVWGSDLGGGELTSPLEGRDLFDLVLSLADGGDPAVDAWAETHARSRRYASIYYSSEGRLLLRPYLAQVAMRTVQEGKHKLIWSAYGDTWELYDLADDPRETHNLVDRRADRRRELAGRLDEQVDTFGPSVPLQASDEALNQMRALGYVDP